MNKRNKTMRVICRVHTMKSHRHDMYSKPVRGEDSPIPVSLAVRDFINVCDLLATFAASNFRKQPTMSRIPLELLLIIGESLAKFVRVNHCLYTCLNPLLYSVALDPANYNWDNKHSRPHLLHNAMQHRRVDTIRKFIELSGGEK
jgi:hypothetical protein